MAGKKKIIFGGSMGNLEDLVQRAGMRLKTGVKQTVKTTDRILEKSKRMPENSANAPTEQEIFREAMDGVERIFWSHKTRLASKPVGAIESDSDSEERRMMQQAMEKDIPIPILDHPEYIEGWIGVAGKRFLADLRNGLYSIQGTIDLHGLTQDEARIAVEDYIIRMSRYRSCCIKIIHGRGINSPTERATLKDSLPRLLSTRRMARYVVAYASAPLRDGGVGSIYVLLGRHLH